VTAECPARKLSPPGVETGPALELVEGAGEPVWVVRSFDLARRILREPAATRQAGFGADQVFRARGMRPPVLYLEGEQHRLQRRAAARFFAPAVIEGYRPMMEQLADQLVARLRADRATDLSRLAMRMAVQVAARVIGLTDSSVSGMSRRLGAFFASNPLADGRSPAALRRRVLGGARTAHFYGADVKPAIRARRRHPGEDIISQLLERGFSDLEILTECITYAAAGMATTRELMVAAAWHLIDDADLLRRYRNCDVIARRRLLEELLRVEPVVGYLRRRTTTPYVVEGEGGTTTIEAGALVDVRLRVVNADPEVVGADGTRVCPSRSLPPSVPPAAMSFGDGHHRCPGGPLAVMESEIFLSRLFASDLVADHPPHVHWNPVSQGYDLSRFPVRLAR
jgi:cytochrome P450